MLTRTYNRILLAVLPSAEVYLGKFVELMVKLDKLTVRIEKHLEDQAVKLATDARRRRLAIEAVNSAFDRRENSTMDAINSARAKLDTAADARDKVAIILDRR